MEETMTIHKIDTHESLIHDRVCCIRADNTKPTKLNRFSSGFTLLELIVSLSVLASLASIAIPSFTNLIARTQVSTQSNAVFEALYLARQYAITKQKNVHICPVEKGNNTRCSSDFGYNASWSNGRRIT